MTRPEYGRRVCLLTGATGLLGRCFCERYSESYQVAAVCHSRSPRTATRLDVAVDPFDTDAVQQRQDSIPYSIRADFTSEEDVDRIVDAAMLRFGRVDVLINAAVLYRFGAVFDPSFLASFHRQFQVNVLAPVRIGALLLEKFWRSREGENRRLGRNIINVSSVSATTVSRSRGHSVYAATKAALNQLTLHMAAEYEPFGIRVNAIAPDSFPSRIKTEQVVDEIIAVDRGDCSGHIANVGRNANKVR